jgi:hypothetical protein
MGIFDMIKEKLGFGDKEENTQVQAAADMPVESEETLEDTAQTSEEAPSVVVAVSEVDVVAKLEALSAQNPGLNWKTSIVDLLKLLGIESSYAHRKELAAEMGIAGYEGTAEQNIALHKAVLKKIAENGGNIPQELLD